MLPSSVMSSRQAICNTGCRKVVRRQLYSGGCLLKLLMIGTFVRTRQKKQNKESHFLPFKYAMTSCIFKMLVQEVRFFFPLRKLLWQKDTGNEDAFKGPPCCTLRKVCGPAQNEGKHFMDTSLCSPIAGKSAGTEKTRVPK